MARPKKTHKDRKTHQVNVHLTKRDYLKIQEKAKVSGKPMAHFLKEAGLTRRVIKVELPPMIKQLLIELSRQGTNLNQIARKVNSNIMVEKELKEQLARTQRLLNNIKLVLLDDRKAD